VTEADGKEAQREVGFQVALELLEKLKQTPGIAGSHIMAVHWEDIIPRLVEEAKLGDVQTK
jgi:methylenetetrahydrofolate reductase (NADPH)